MGHCERRCHCSSAPQKRNDNVAECGNAKTSVQVNEAHFIALSRPSIEMTDSQVSHNHHTLLQDEFFEELDGNGSEDLPDVWQPLDEWLSLHPKYNAVFKSSIDHIFYGNGPLPMTERHYIALMAANRHVCSYLMDLHQREFERLGGDADWLNGLTSAPSKIVKLDAINKVLGHQPWSITVEQLKALTKCSAPDNWSLTELVQGVVILSTTHALCSFVFGCGNIYPSELTPQELDAPMMRRSPRSSDETPTGEVEELMKRMAALRDVTNGADSTDEDKARRFLDMNRESSAISPEPNGDKKSGRSPPRAGAQFTKDLSFTYVDFAQRPDASSAPTLKIHDFSWEDQGFSCVDELYQETSDHLDRKFHLTQELTYYTMGNHTDVDTSKYRTAVWMYIQSLYGIRHDDYDYAEVNLMLNRPMKTFIKTVCCYPERATDSLRASVMVDFKLSEKVHVMLMILEARLQAELLYFLRAVMRLNNSASVAS